MTPPSARALLLLAPALVPTLLVVGTGVAATGLQSAGLMPLVGQPAAGVGAYRAVLSTQDVGGAVVLSLALAAAATVLAVTTGFGLAVLALRGRTTGRLVRAAAVATIPVPHVVGAASVGLLLADAGLLARVVGAEPGSFPQLVAGPWWIATVVEYAWKESAFVAVVALAVLSREEPALREVAATLGAAPAQRLRRVTLPLAAPSLVATGGISFAYVLGSYEVPWLLGRTAPEPLPVLALRLLGDLDLTTRPQAAAVGVVTVVLALVALGRHRRRAARGPEVVVSRTARCRRRSGERPCWWPPAASPWCGW